MINSKDKYELRFIDLFLLFLIVVGFVAFVNAQEEPADDNSEVSSKQTASLDNVGDVQEKENAVLVETEKDEVELEKESIETEKEVYVNLDEIIEIVEERNDSEQDLVSNLSVKSVENLSETREVNYYYDNISLEDNFTESKSNIVEYDEVYVNLDEIPEVSSSNQESDEAQYVEELNEITYVLYDGNIKQVETTVLEGSNLVIDVDSTTVIEPEWKKEVTIYSNKHHENPVILYSEVEESENTIINILWKEEKQNLEYQSFDSDADGLTDKISWVVPHLSEQNFLITLNESNSTNSTNQILITSPTFNSDVTSSPASLVFGINSTNNQVPQCNLSLFKSGNLVDSSIFNSNTIVHNVSVDNGSYNWNITCFEGLENTTNSATGSFVVNLSSQTNITFSGATQIVKNATYQVVLNISSSISPIRYTINWNDGTSLHDSGTINSASVNTLVSHVFSNSGSYSINLTVITGGVSYERKVNVTVIAPAAYIDNSDPSISLLYPSNGADLTGSTVNFSYSVSDNIKLSNCTLSVYYYQNNSLLGSLFYSKTDTSFGNGTMFVYVNNFLNGDYSWDVGCYDNSSNYDEMNRDFQIVSSQVYLNYAQPSSNLSSKDQEIVDDIDDLIDRVNTFLTKSSSYGVKEREAINDLDIDSKMSNYKKVLLQNKLDMTYNIGFIRDATQREQRKQEIKDGLLDMYSKIPSDIRVLDSYDYYKSESKEGIGEVVNAMLKVNGFSVNEQTFNLIVSYVQGLQENSVVSNNVKHVEIDYGPVTEEISLVRKELQLSNNSFDFFVERVPSEFKSSNLIFITKSKSLGSNLFQIQPADLSDEKIIYYVTDKINLKEFEKTGLVLFSDESLTIKSAPGITGFVSYLGGEGSVFSWQYILGFVFVFVFLFGGGYYIRQYQVHSLAGQSEDFKIILTKIDGASKLVQLKDFESAKTEYRNIKEKYSSLSEDAKRMVYKPIKNLQTELDRKEAIELVKEFIATIKQGRKEEALMLYNKIKSVYPRLPEEDRKKGYEKIAPYLGMLNLR